VQIFLQSVTTSPAGDSIGLLQAGRALFAHIELLFSAVQGRCSGKGPNQGLWYMYTVAKERNKNDTGRQGS